MKKFEATKYDGKTLELQSSERIQELYELLEKEENFILEWTEGTVKMGRLMIGTELFPKIKAGDLALTAKGR